MWVLFETGLWDRAWLGPCWGDPVGAWFGPNLGWMEPGWGSFGVMFCGNLGHNWSHVGAKLGLVGAR